MTDLAAAWDRSDATTVEVGSVFDLLERPAWFARAACRGLDPELFYPGRGDDLGPVRAVCGECPVREDCLSHAVATGEKFGIWGGVSERARRSLRRESLSRVAGAASNQRSALHVWRRSEEARDLRAQRAELCALLYLDGVKPAEIGRLAKIATNEAQRVVHDALRQLAS